MVASDEADRGHLETTCSNFVHKSWEEWIIYSNCIDTTTRSYLIAFNGVLIFSTIFLNLLSVMTIRKSSQLKNKLCYFVILLQSVVDLCVGLFSIPLFIIFVATPFLGIKNCLTIVVLTNSILLLPGSSAVTLTAMTIERYVGVLHPYSYKTLLTKSRILLFVCSMLFTSIILLIASIRFMSVLLYTTTFSISLLLIFSVYAYTRIYLAIRKLDDRERRPGDIMMQKQGQHRKITLLQNIKRGKPCFIAVFFFVLCWLPSGMGPLNLNAGQLDKGAYSAWSMTLIFLNSNFNSIIFFWNNTLLKKEAVKTIKSVISRNSA